MFLSQFDDEKSEFVVGFLPKNPKLWLGISFRFKKLGFH